MEQAAEDVNEDLEGDDWTPTKTQHYHLKRVELMEKKVVLSALDVN